MRGGRKHLKSYGYLVYPKPLTEEFINSVIGRESRKKLRILLSKGCKCVDCGSDDKLTLDHIIPKRNGSKKYNHFNTVVRCVDCHRKKDNLEYKNYLQEQ